LSPFSLTVLSLSALSRRLASGPEAILNSRKIRRAQLLIQASKLLLKHLQSGCFRLRKLISGEVCKVLRPRAIIAHCGVSVHGMLMVMLMIVVLCMLHTFSSLGPHPLGTGNP
jgi:hypothetical protein